MQTGCAAGPEGRTARSPSDPVEGCPQENLPTRAGVEALPGGVAVTVQHWSQGVRASQGGGGSEPVRPELVSLGLGVQLESAAGRAQRQSESKPWSEGATEAHPMGAVCLDRRF